MRKLRLEIDALLVESFRTADAGTWKGTVDARSEFDDDGVIIGDDNEIAPPPKTLPPAASCDTCYRTCVTGCTCATNPGCTTCT